MILNPKVLTKKGLTIQKRTRNYDFPTHIHTYFEIEYIFSGQGIMTINGKEHEIKDNTMFFLTPMDFQSMHNISKPIEYINISFDELWIAEDVHDLISNNIILDNFKSEIIDMLYNETKKSQILNYRYVKNLLNCLLIQMLRAVKSTDNEINSNKNTGHIPRVLQYIHLHFKDQISIDLLSKQVNLSPNYLCTVFRNITGKTIFEYLTDFRLDFAAKLLIYTEQSLTEICFNSGFNSYSHFMRTFKTKYNCTPKQFRKGNTSDEI